MQVKCFKVLFLVYLRGPNKRRKKNTQPSFVLPPPSFSLSFIPTSILFVLHFVPPHLPPLPPPSSSLSSSLLLSFLPRLSLILTLSIAASRSVWSRVFVSRAGWLTAEREPGSSLVTDKDFGSITHWVQHTHTHKHSHTYINSHPSSHVHMDSLTSARVHVSTHTPGPMLLPEIGREQANLFASGGSV